MEKIANVIRFVAFLCSNQFEEKDADFVLNYGKELGLSEDIMEMIMVIILQEKFKAQMRNAKNTKEPCSEECESKRPEKSEAVKKELEELKRLIEEA